MTAQLDVQPAQAVRAHPRNLTVALIVIAFAQLMVVLDTTIVNVALPSIQRGLGFSATGLEWVVNAYALAFGGLLLLGGRAGDLFGRRRMFIAGVLLFAGGSLAGGLASAPWWLIAARAFQGAGAAIVAPTALSLIADTFHEGAARNRALGIYAGAAGGGGAVGLVLGGLITNYVSWRWVLFVNVPIALVLALAAPRVLAAPQGRTGRLDLPGALASSAGLALLVYGLSRVASYPWSDSGTVVAIGLGAAMLVLFMIIELRSAQPLLPLRVFASRNRSAAYGLRFVAGGMIISILFFLTQIMQNVLGYSPLQAGLAFLPLGVTVVITAQVASRIIARTGPRGPITIGTILLGVGMLWLSRITGQPVYVTSILGPLIILSAGLGLVFLPTTLLAVAGSSRQDSGVAAAVLNVSQQVGGSVGLAVLGTLAAHVATDRLAGLRPTHQLVGQAITAGFASAYEVQVGVAMAALVIAVVAVRARRPERAAEALREAA